MLTVRSKIFGVGAILVFAGLFPLFFYLLLRPVAAQNSPASNQKFRIQSREGFREITDSLGSAGLIRAPRVFEFYLLISGNARRLKPGEYDFSAHMSSWSIAQALRSGPDNQVKIFIPEGSSVFEIDKLLSDGGVFKDGELISYASRNQVEGKLFPDTYIFYKNSGVAAAVQKMTANFKAKAAPLLSSRGDFNKNLILASLLEKEVPTLEEKRIVAGILLKRVVNGMPLQVDSTLCYMKKLDGSDRCYPLTQKDIKQDSPYNTYVYYSWPAGAIANPGLDSIKAALNPETSPYWFYLSDPATKRTIFSNTLDTHKANVVKYLLNS